MTSSSNLHLEKKRQRSKILNELDYKLKYFKSNFNSNADINMDKIIEDKDDDREYQ
jgi:hypothetical protein